MGDPCGECEVDASAAPAPMLTTMTVAPGCELSARASEHLRFSPGEARPELGLEGGEAPASGESKAPFSLDGGGMQLFSDGYDLKRPKSVDSNLASWSKSALTM